MNYPETDLSRVSPGLTSTAVWECMIKHLNGLKRPMIEESHLFATVLSFPSGESVFYLIPVLLMMTVVLFVVFRFGLLALLAGVLFYSLLRCFPNHDGSFGPGIRESG